MTTEPLDLNRLTSGEDVPAAWIEELNTLTPGQIPGFLASWDSLPESRRLGLIRLLRILEERQPQLDFREIYHLAMGDPSAQVRRAAVDASGQDESLWLMERLQQLTRNDSSPAVRAAAAESLGRFVRAVELGELPARWAAELTATLLGAVERADEAAEVRANALASLGYLSTDAVRDSIARAAASDDPVLRLGALRAMGHNCDPRWLSQVEHWFTSDDARFREEAARASGEIADERAVGALVDLLDDTEQSVRLAAIAALGQIGGEEAEEALIYCLEAPDEAMRRAAEEALENLAFDADPLNLTQ